MGTISRSIDKALTVTKTRPRSTQNQKSGVSALVRESRRQRPPNAAMYRSWATHSPVVRAAIDHLKNQCRRAQWDLVPFSRDLPEPDKGLIRDMRDVLDQPNPEDSSFGEMFERVIEDQLVLDAGVIEKERRYRGDLVGLHPTMGEFVKVDRFWNGDPKSPRYFWEPDPSVSESFLNANMIYGKIHPRTNSGVGISYLETAKNTIENLISASAYNGRMVRQAVPDGVMDLGETARPDQVDAFKAYFASELEGKEVLGFWGGTRGAKFIPLRGAGNSNRDMQYTEWLIFEIRIMAAVFHISTQDLAFGFDINKANGEVQQENSETAGALPILEKWQDYFTAEYCWDPMWGGKANNIAFRFKDVTQRQSLQKAQTHKITLAGMPYQSINEARAEVGLPPLAPPNFAGDVLGPENPYNQLQANTSQGLVLLGDVMTARELAERDQAPPELGPGPAETQKMIEKAIRARTEEEMRAQLLEIAKMSAGAPHEVNVTTPPVNVIVTDAGLRDETSPPNIDPEPEQIGPVKRDTRFISEKGQIVAKVETETREYVPDVVRELERVEKDVRVAEALAKTSVPAYERKQARLDEIREEAAGAKPLVKRIVRETRFDLDENGVVTGKTETEREETDAD